MPWREGEDRPQSVLHDSDVPPTLDTSPDQDDRRKCRLLERWSVCWLVSAIVNLILLLTAALFLIPFDRGMGPFTLIARVGVEEGELETLSESANTASLDFGVALEPPKIDPFATTEVSIDLDLAGGSIGQGPGGWQGGAGSGGSGSGTEYFGTVAYGNRFVYILDKSTSMNHSRSGPPAPDSRFARARNELLRSIDKLAPYQSFYVILFSTKTRRMFDDESLAPVTIPATPENKLRLREWLEAAEVGGGTDPREALFLALSIAPDAVFFLSDGDFNRVNGRRKNRLFAGDPEAEQLVERVNRTDTPVHTFAYEDPSSKRRMEDIAQLSGGDYRFIPPPDRDAIKDFVRKLR
jgi:hypothetical protein